MADNQPNGQSTASFESSPPRGLNVEDGLSHAGQTSDLDATDASDSLDNMPTEGAIMTDLNNDIDQNETMQQIEQSLDYRQFSPGFSDDEDNGQAFEHDWSSRQAKRQAVKAAKSKKSPRRSDDDADLEPRVRTKKPRPSLFVSPHADISEEEQADVSSAPATPGHIIGNRMSSLNLDAEEADDETIARNVSNGFGLACSDIGSVHNSPAPSDDEFTIPPDPIPYYELRQNIDRKKAITHVDTDKSGNWDPDQEAKERQKKALRARVAKKERKQKKEKKGKGKKRGEDVDDTMKHIVKLRFENFGNVRNATNDEQNWPGGWSDIDSDFRVSFRENTPDRAEQKALEDPADPEHDLTGHPEARGCRSCRRLKQSCSIVRSGQYPCDECLQDGSVCHLIQEPAVKWACQHCQKTGEVQCSFEIGPTQSICDNCAVNGHVCEVLPPSGYKAPRISLDEKIYGSDRAYIACTNCRLIKKPCSLKSKKSSPPCKRCVKEEIGCTFVDLPNPVKQIRRANGKAPADITEVTEPQNEFFTQEDIATMHKRSTNAPSPEPVPEMEMEDGNGNRGMLTIITTSFAHPIKFSIEDDAQVSCNFCEMPIFGIVGYFEREVYVIRWHDGLGFAEMGGGYSQDNGNTTMCGECTRRRLQILVCEKHQLEPIPDAGTNHMELAEELVATEPGGADMQYQLSRWCSMCFSPAAFGCSTLQADLSGGDEEHEIEGCHLRLCFDCEVALRTRFGGNLDAMATEFDAQPKISEADETLDKQLDGRPRADVGFLRQGGLLMRRFMESEG